MPRPWRRANTNASNNIDLIVEDMQGTPDAYADDVSGYVTWNQPRINVGNTPNLVPRGFGRYQFAGTVFNAAGTTPPANVRVAIRNLRGYILSIATNTWSAIQVDPTHDGLHYTWDYGTVGPAPSFRTESDGSKSVTMLDNYIYHYWPSPSTIQKVVINNTDVAGVWGAAQLRIIMDDPNGVDNRAIARFLHQTGGDWYKNPLTGEPAPVGNDDVALSRFRYLTSDWQWFNVHSMTASAIRSNPPPFNS